ncbi:MAG TPA: PilZ domain-containing protein [Novosphingobium sp.]
MVMIARLPEQTLVEQRGESRLRVGLPGVLITRDGTRRVIVADLSGAGARIRGTVPYSTGEQAMLQWARFEALGTVWWSEDGDCAIRFAEPVPAADLLATRDLADRARCPDERDLVRRTAAAFVNGRMRL